MDKVSRLTWERKDTLRLAMIVAVLAAAALLLAGPEGFREGLELLRAGAP